MDDLSSLSEALAFHILGRVPEINEMPFREIDAYRHGVDLQQHISDMEYAELMMRFGKTFNGLAKPVGGGEVIYVPDEE